MRSTAMIALAAALAVAPVAADTIAVDFDPKAEFESFATWDWAPGRDEGHKGVLSNPMTRQRVEEAVAAQMDLAGLRRAASGEAPDLLVRYQGDIGSGMNAPTSVGTKGHGPMVFTEMTATLVVDLVAKRTDTLAWRLYLDQAYGRPTDPPDKLRKALEKGFKKYPPSPSARAKKAKQLEKGN